MTDAQTDQWVKQNEKALRAKLRDSEADVRAGRVTRFDPADPLAALRLGRAECEISRQSAKAARLRLQ